jgi:RNA polymerase sigma-70 factor, ECF subfamily
MSSVRAAILLLDPSEEGSLKKENEPHPSGRAASLDQVKSSVYSDLQYVSLELDGKTYGGWYRQLPDGRMELLALANMHSERRPEGTAIEQARGMLADFVRSARRNGLNGHDACDVCDPSGDSDEAEAPSTLGDLLYADKTKSRTAEDDWIGLVRSVAAGDQTALDQLFARTHRIVFTLMMRLVRNRDVAEELTVTVFHDVWRHAAHFDAAGGPVLAWLLDQARLRALERLELEQASNSGAADTQEQAVRLRNAAVTSLSMDERQLIEAAYFSKLSYRELAEQRQQSPEAVKRDIHSGMEKLRDQLGTEMERP